jgi:hypothetical protein
MNGEVRVAERGNGLPAPRGARWALSRRTACRSPASQEERQTVNRTPPAERLRSAATANTARLGRLLMLVGLGLFVAGAAGDITYHALPHQLGHALEPVLGVEAYRAHLATLAGMLLVVCGVFWKGARDLYANRYR